MKISFYKEQRVYGNPAKEVSEAIEILKALPMLTLDFNENISTINIEFPDITDDYELQILFNFTLKDEEYNDNWYESHYNLLNEQNDTNDILIYFHETNPWRWYSHIGIGNNNGQRLITIATSNEIWHNIPNKPAALAHEIISSILLSQAINSIDEYHKLPGNISFKPGSLADGLWLEKTKKYDNVLSNIITNNMYEAGTKMMQLKIKSADIEDELLDYLNNRNVNEFLIRDIVSGLKALAHSNSNVVRKGLDTFKPSRIALNLRNREIIFLDIDRKLKLPPLPFTLYCIYLIARDGIKYTEVANDRQTFDSLYDAIALHDNRNRNRIDTDNLFINPGYGLKSIKNDIIERFKKEFSNVEGYESFFTPEDRTSRMFSQLNYCFDKKWRLILENIISNSESEKIRNANISFCNIN